MGIDHQSAFTGLDKPTAVKVSKHSEVYSVDFLTFSNIFPVISKNRRNELTDTKTDPELIIEISVTRVYTTRQANKVSLNGPVLCSFDGTVYSVLVALYFENSCQNGKVTTSYAEIAKKLNIKAGNSGQKQIKRSLSRLSDFVFKIYEKDVPTENIHLVNKVRKVGKGKGCKLSIRLEEDWINEIYKKKKFSTQELPVIASLRGEYAPSLYRILSYHRGKSQELEFETSDLFDLLIEKSCDEQQPVWFDLTKSKRDSFIRNLRKACKSLVEQGVILEMSSIASDSCRFFLNMDLQ